MRWLVAPTRRRRHQSRAARARRRGFIGHTTWSAPGGQPRAPSRSRRPTRPPPPHHGPAIRRAGGGPCCRDLAALQIVPGDRGRGPSHARAPASGHRKAHPWANALRYQRAAARPDTASATDAARRSRRSGAAACAPTAAAAVAEYEHRLSAISRGKLSHGFHLEHQFSEQLSSSPDAGSTPNDWRRNG